MTEEVEEKETRRSALLIVDNIDLVSRIRDWSGEEGDEVYTNFTVWFEAITDCYTQGRFNTRPIAEKLVKRKLRNAETLVVVAFAKNVDETFEEWCLRSTTHPVMAILGRQFMNMLIATKDNMAIY